MTKTTPNVGTIAYKMEVTGTIIPEGGISLETTTNKAEEVDITSN